MGELAVELLAIAHKYEMVNLMECAERVISDTLTVDSFRTTISCSDLLECVY
jgi:hypothetical protein